MDQLKLISRKVLSANNFIFIFCLRINRFFWGLFTFGVNPHLINYIIKIHSWLFHYYLLFVYRLIHYSLSNSFPSHSTVSQNGQNIPSSCELGWNVRQLVISQGAWVLKAAEGRELRRLALYETLARIAG
jgi:hypothetical protein